MISIVIVNCDFSKCFLLFSVRHEMSMLHYFVDCEWAFLFSMKPDLYPPLPPSTMAGATMPARYVPSTGF